MRRQQTIQTHALLSGVGVHTGVRSQVRLCPAPAHAGVTFVRVDLDPHAIIPTHVRNIADTTQCTRLRGPTGAEIATVEHLLAAAAALGVDNLRVEVNAAELPILDGSAAPFASAMLEAGLVTQSAPRRRLRVRDRVEVRDGDKFALLEPSDVAEIDVTIRYRDPAIGVQRRCVSLNPQALALEVLGARTFGFLKDVERFRSMGLALGASLENTVAVDDGRVVNEEGLRFADEFVRHKILDVLGDLALAGGALQGRYVGDQPGHSLNAALVSKLLATPGAWTWEADAQESLALAG